MPRLRIHCLSVSVDGFIAGPDQSLDAPLGIGGEALHEWMFAPRDVTGVNERFVDAGFDGIGAWILGRNMFGPIRGEWGDSDWSGWWGDDPPYHCDVFVLTHHSREPVEMAGGTTFHFVTDGPEAAWERAAASAGDLDVRLGGGAATVHQYLELGLVDSMHLVVPPVLLGDGERPFPTRFTADGLTCRVERGELDVVHYVFERA